jgi:hypothetical protein
MKTCNYRWCHYYKNGCPEEECIIPPKVLIIWERDHQENLIKSRQQRFANGNHERGKGGNGHAY